MSNLSLLNAAGIVWLSWISVFECGPEHGKTETGLERVAALEQTSTNTSARPPYDVAMLGVSELRRGAEKRVGFEFVGSHSSPRATALIKWLAYSKVLVKLKIRNLTMVPAGTRYVAWAVSPAGNYTRLGQLVVTSGQYEARIEAKVMLREFGLFLTGETEARPSSPKGRLVAKAGSNRT